MEKNNSTKATSPRSSESGVNLSPLRRIWQEQQLDAVTDPAAKTPANAIAEAILYRALSRGLSFKVTMGNVLTLTPPLIITEQQIDDCPFLGVPACGRNDAGEDAGAPREQASTSGQPIYPVIRLSFPSVI